MPDPFNQTIERPKATQHVVLVHGLLDTARLWRRMARTLRKTGFTPHAINLKPNNGSLPLPELAVQLAEYIRVEVPPSEKCVLVGFSMGGMVSRYYLQRLDGLDRVSRYVSIAAPNLGTTSGFAGGPWLRAGWQMRVGSHFLHELNRDRERLLPLRPVSIWTPDDLVIIPPENCILPGSESVRIPALGHAFLPRDKRCVAVVLQVCGEDGTPLY